MYIEPNTSIYILKGVPLDPTYDHTIYWYDINAQVNYFYSKMKYTFARQTYQRVNRGYMRIQRKAEDLYDCNYLMFQNTAFGNKWFFAFITEINYVNNEVSEVKYQIDVMQTYHFDYSLGQCFVEREHSATDNIGDNLVPENLDVGELITSAGTTHTLFKNWDIVFWCTKIDGVNVSGRIDPASKTITGLVPKCFSYIRNGTFDVQGVQEALTWWTNQLIKPAQLITVCPSHWVENMKKWLDGDYENYVWSAPISSITINRTGLRRLDGTYVKNNKCYTYPFYFLYATNNQGLGMEYKLEYFGHDSETDPSGNKFLFDYYGSPTPDCTIVCKPRYYLNNLNTENSDNDYSITLQTMTQVALNEDAFIAWFAQKGSSNILPASFIGEQAIELYQSKDWSSPKHFEGSAKHYKSHPKHFDKEDWSAYSTDSMLGNAGYFGVISMLAEGMKSVLTPARNIGAEGSFSGISADSCKLTFMVRHITPMYATIIDDFFTRYGYASRRLKVPNRDARPQFTFVKTLDCLIEALDTTGHGLPADDEATICEIYNKGITFWKNPANIGDYTVNNAPTNQ